jgi:toxin-antitoxin system PIN domain toxin
LLDASVLIAMSWPAHEAHQKVQRWFATEASSGWATCPFTQTAFVRILSNPTFSPHALPPGDAFALLKQNLSHPGHRFWADEISVDEATREFQARIVGHQQVTDAYLLGLAAHKRCKLVTLDSGISALVCDKRRERELLIVL